MFLLFLDDMRYPHDVTWVKFPLKKHENNICIARNYDQFTEIVTTYGMPEFVCFDHDLADYHYEAMFKETQGHEDVDYGPEKTGFDCAKWLVDYCAENGLKFPSYVVHSMNPIGKERIEGYINNAKKHLDI